MSATTLARQISPFSSAPSQNSLQSVRTELLQSAKPPSGIVTIQRKLALDSLKLWTNMVKCQCAYRRRSIASLNERGKCSDRKRNVAQCDAKSARCSTTLELFLICVRTLPTPSLVPYLPPGRPSCNKPAHESIALYG